VYAGKLDAATGVVDGDLIVRGRGDPTLSVVDLRALADEVVAHGVREVKGALVVDAGYFDDAIEPPHFDEQKQERAGFRAPIAAFGVARSAVTAIVIAEPGGKAKVRLEPPAGDYVRVTKLDVLSVPTGKSRVRGDVVLAADHIELTISGQIRAADGSYELRKRVEDPVRFAGEVLRAALAERGVKIHDKRIGRGTVPIGALVVGTHDSAELADVLRGMNKYSDNFVAESLLKTLGAETRAQPGPATWADGTAAVRAYLTKLGVTGTWRADNGSGLFDASSVSPRQLIAILKAAYHDARIGPALLASLPIGGVDGTLAKRWHDQPARGRVYAKTGTLDKVTALAGYVEVDGAHPIAFVIVANEIPNAGRPATRAAQDEIVAALVAYLR
jgi:D-alanyl-D-alanine carboxypeptidase/D-alanyl-D-alanine-endopeptidase (penicillin-binding protein 4)